MKRLRVALPMLAIVLAVLVACGGRGRRGTGAGTATTVRPATVADRMIALLPDGVQVLVELDFARLRANETVGPVATKALAGLGEDAKLPGLPMSVQGSPLANADAIVLAAYGVGTASAATVTLLATRHDVPNATPLADGIVALGPPEWIAQLEARAAIAARSPLAPSLSLMTLRDHAMPAKAPGAVLRVTARLPFDARIALAQQLGLPTAPAQLSVWGDVVDDIAIIVDADAADPGDKKPKDAAQRLATAMNALLASLGDEPAFRALGLTGALRDVRMITERTWVRTIITVGPRQVARAVQRASALLGERPAQ
jgi:hypothetical protein